MTATPSEDGNDPRERETLSDVRAGVLRRPGLVGVELRHALSDAYDEWLAPLVVDPQRTALVAVGGYGRREMAPYSDLDLVLLHDGSVPRLADVADAVWYPIWDSGMSLDHSVRTADQAVSVARDDLKAMLGLLDVRHIAGDAALTERVRSGVRDAWRRGAAKRLAEFRALSRERWAIAGEAAFLLQPNLKDSRGGLRDARGLHALAVAQLVDYPVWVREAYPVLLDVRGELQRLTGRADDVLRQQEHDGVAAALGVGDESDPTLTGGVTLEARDVLLRRVNEAGRAIAHAVDVAFRRADPGPSGGWMRNRLFGSRAQPQRVGLARDVVAQDGEVVLARDAHPARDPGLLLRVARAAAEHDLAVAPFALERIAAETPSLPEPWPESARDDLVAVLGAGRPGIAVLETLDQAGLLATLIPEWDAVRCRAQHNPVHRFTVDRHLLETAAAAATTNGDVGRRDLLLVGALLHDIGKGFPSPDHSITGAEHAAVIGARMGYTGDDLDTVVALVRHHLLLPNTATRRDLDDPMTIDIVRDAVDGSAELLDLLHVLAAADGAATSPAAWTEWKAGLVDDLVRRTHASIGGSRTVDAPPLDDEHRALAEAGELAVHVEGDQVTVVVTDRPGALSRTSGVLALHSLDVRSASVVTHDGMAVNRFVVHPRFGRMPDPALVRGDLVRAERGELGLADRLRQKERAYSRRPDTERPMPTVRWFDDSADATVVEFRGTDEIGLLSRITAALETAGLDVRSARVTSVAGRVVDAFYVTGTDGAPVQVDDRPRLEAALRAFWGSTRTDDVAHDTETAGKQR